MKLPLLLAGALAAGALALPAAASADVVWLCKPGTQPDPCRESNKTTVENKDGTTKVIDPAFPKKPPVDCFYVYPTVSGQQGTNADKTKDAEEMEIARYQAARFSLDCNVYAPMYRQLTLASIYTGSTEDRAKGRQLAFGDVREAWREYLKKYNHGRGVMFIGHSQGASMLRLLLRAEVDPKPKVRKLMVSGALLGGNVLVKKGKKIGGDFQHIPACTKPRQTGCVMAWSTFDEAPPDNTRFGRAPETDTSGSGLPAGPAYEVLCTNPGSLDKNATRTFTDILRSEPFPGAIGAALVVMYGGPPPSADTPWLEPKDEYAGKCESSNGANVLMVHPVGDSRKLNASPTPDWGLHLADVNLPLGELVQDVSRQAKAWLKARKVSRPHGSRRQG